MTGVKGFYRCVKKSLGAAAGLLVIDAAYFGSIMFSSVVCPIWTLVSLLKNAIERPGWGLALVRIGIPALTFWLVKVNNDFQLAVAKENARRVVSACEKYHAANGRFPGSLDELVPEYMHSVPWAKYCLGPGGNFYYYYHFGKPMLVWQVLTPYSRRIYNFDTRSWSYLD